MSAIRWLDDGARARFEARGLRDIDDFCAFEGGEPVSRARTRRLVRVRLDDEVYYVKVQQLSAGLPLRKWPSYAFRGSPLEREFRNLERLRAAGFRTPEPVLVGRRSGVLWPRAAVFATKELEGYVDLARFLRSRPPRAAAEAAVHAAEQLVESVHRAGFVLLGAKYRNILLPEVGADQPSAFALVDQPGMRRTRSERLRAKDRRLMAFDRARYAGALALSSSPGQEQPVGSQE